MKDGESVVSCGHVVTSNKVWKTVREPVLLPAAVGASVSKPSGLGLKGPRQDGK